MQAPQAAITRIYPSMDSFQRDAANVAPYGWVPVNVVPQDHTNGCLLTFLLVAGLVLTPVCIGVFLLILIPTAFSKSVTVTYFYNPHARVVVGPSALPAYQPASNVPESGPFAWLQARVLQPIDAAVARYISHPALRLTLYVAICLACLILTITVLVAVDKLYIGY